MGPKRTIRSAESDEVKRLNSLISRLKMEKEDLKDALMRTQTTLEQTTRPKHGQKANLDWGLLFPQREPSSGSHRSEATQQSCLKLHLNDSKNNVELEDNDSSEHTPVSKEHSRYREIPSDEEGAECTSESD